jgi:hypothetical protein
MDWCVCEDMGPLTMDQFTSQCCSCDTRRLLQTDARCGIRPSDGGAQRDQMGRQATDGGQVHRQQTAAKHTRRVQHSREKKERRRSQLQPSSPRWRNPFPSNAVADRTSLWREQCASRGWRKARGSDAVCLVTGGGGCPGRHARWFTLAFFGEMRAWCAVNSVTKRCHHRDEARAVRLVVICFGVC